jgi:(+)-abscisic acid 8'-hydroxylase
MMMKMIGKEIKRRYIMGCKIVFSVLLQVPPRPNTYMPFGNGVHSCPGSELAKLEMLILLHHLTTTYRSPPSYKLIYQAHIKSTKNKLKTYNMKGCHYVKTSIEKQRCD